MSGLGWRGRAGLGTVLVVAATAASGITSAGADPKNGIPLTIECDNGVTYDATSNGDGAWTPAHDLNSTAILVPTSFGPGTFTVTDEEGNVLESETDEGGVKGKADRTRQTSTACSYTGVATFEDPELGLITFTITGTVTGFVTPVR